MFYTPFPAAGWMFLGVGFFSSKSLLITIDYTGIPPTF
jgi:hypothetical protein